MANPNLPCSNSICCLWWIAGGSDVGDTRTSGDVYLVSAKSRWWRKVTEAFLLFSGHWVFRDSKALLIYHTSLSIHVFVCVCTCACVCVYVHVYVQVHVEVRGRCSVSTISNFHLIFWGSVSHWVRVLSQELSGTSLSAQWGLGSAFLHLFPSPSAGVTVFCCHIWFQSVGSKHFPRSSHFYSFPLFLNVLRWFLTLRLGTPFLCSVVPPLPSEGIWDAEEAFWTIVVPGERGQRCW